MLKNIFWRLYHFLIVSLPNKTNIKRYKGE
jgi:hypothetical protein